MASEFKNSLLKSLDSEVIARLGLSDISFELGHEIEFPGKTIEHVFFVEEGMASMTTTFKDGSQVEVCMFGYESMIGVSALMGTRRSLNRVYTQIEGRGYSCLVEAARNEFGRCEAFHAVALRYVQAQLVQSMQSTGCNAKHEVHQRLARWLLICADRAHSNNFKMSQEFLSHMLGSSRPTVSMAAALLKEKQLITYVRGVIRILNPKGLETEACECYHIIKDHLDNYTEFDSGIVA
jgi:CRP-like cAMP-binding protein